MNNSDLELAAANLARDLGRVMADLPKPDGEPTEAEVDLGSLVCLLDDLPAVLHLARLATTPHAPDGYIQGDFLSHLGAATRIAQIRPSWEYPGALWLYDAPLPTCKPTGQKAVIATPWSIDGDPSGVHLDLQLDNETVASLFVKLPFTGKPFDDADAFTAAVYPIVRAYFDG